MSYSESVEFASFPIISENPKELHSAFAAYCLSNAAESASNPSSSLANSAEWENFIYKCGEDKSMIKDLSPLIAQISSSIQTATSIRYKWCSKTKTNQPFLQVRTDQDGVSYDLYLWILECCLEFPPFALESIISQAVINDSREGMSIHEYVYSLEDL